MDPDVQRI